MDKNQGYAILKAVMLENGRGFALGEHPTAPSRYVTWACYDDKDGQRQYEWGHYGIDRTAMEPDFTDRVQDDQRIYNVGISQTEAPGLYKYYSTQRPVDIGTFPKPVSYTHLDVYKRQPIPTPANWSRTFALAPAQPRLQPSTQNLSLIHI